ncbi:hypothetical protein [Halobacterium zhouii]|uniref:hypothetical protein n=1 Tax=Halobacterium zhouii TaxID=2902624 RepID=UPI001E45D38C|nr:hypothetical protein [Halobacterium zhouii]
MQRRAAAVSIAIFLLLAAGSYSLIGAAQQPSVTVENPDYSVAANESRTISGTTYTFTEVGSDSATATWTNESARQTATLDAGQNVTYEGDNYSVFIPNASNVSEFELREVQTVDRPTVEQNGTTYVIVEEDGDRVLVPREEYLPEQTVHTFQVGDEFPYQGNSTTVASVANTSVTLEWFAPEQMSVEFSEGENTTIGDVNYLAHFDPAEGPSEDKSLLKLTTKYRDYHEDTEAQTFFHERMSGLWGIVILSSIAAALLAMLAYLPSRY